MRRLGLRARVTAGFAVGALLLVRGRWRCCLVRADPPLPARRAGAHRRCGPRTSTPPSSEPGSTPTTPTSSRCCARWTPAAAAGALLHRDGEWYARTADAGNTAASPRRPATTSSASGKPAVQRVRVDGQPALVVGVPLAQATGYYEITYAAGARADLPGPRRSP